MPLTLWTFLQSSTRKPEQQPRPPLTVTGGVEHMSQLVVTMLREWEVATHNATMAALREAEAQTASAAAAASNGNAPAEAAAPEPSAAVAAAGV